MLKIKNDVDLKELEKFGFTKDNFFTERYKEENVYALDTCKESYNSEFIVIRNREIKIYIDDEYYCCFTDTETLDTIFDLIQAGLVEKN